jgi:uncharacterized damage-inducible protein DinB
MDLSGYRRDVVREFRRTKDLADKAMAQVSDDAFFAAPDAQTNSIAILVKHVAGNLRSRWSDFLTTDGEKPDRNRDAEFVIGPEDGRAALMARWERGWSILFATLDALRDEDLDATVTIRNEPHTVYQAIHRQLTHYAYHAGQIVLLARHYVGDEWKTLSVARGASAAFNQSPTGYLGKRGK